MTAVRRSREHGLPVSIMTQFQVHVPIIGPARCVDRNLWKIRVLVALLDDDRSGINGSVTCVLSHEDSEGPEGRGSRGGHLATAPREVDVFRAVKGQARGDATIALFEGRGLSLR